MLTAGVWFMMFMTTVAMCFSATALPARFRKSAARGVSSVILMLLVYSIYFATLTGMLRELR